MKAIGIKAVEQGEGDEVVFIAVDGTRIKASRAQMCRQFAEQTVLVSCEVTANVSRTYSVPVPAAISLEPEKVRLWIEEYFDRRGFDDGHSDEIIEDLQVEIVEDEA